MKLSDLLADIGVSSIDEFKQEFHVVNGYQCRIIYNKGYYMASIINIPGNVFDCNHHTDVNLNFVDGLETGLIRTFKTRSFVLNELYLLTTLIVTPSAPPPE